MGQKETEAKKIAKLLKTRPSQIQKDFALTKKRTELMGLSMQARQDFFFYRNNIYARNEAGIEIPFAQLDVHLDTSRGPLEIRMPKGKDV